MAISVVKRPLSGMTIGVSQTWIQLSGTIGTCTVIHNLTHSSTNVHDVVYVYAYNSKTSAETIFLNWGQSNNKINIEVPGETYHYPIVEGLELWGVTAASGVSIKGGATTSASNWITGHISRYFEY